MKTLLISLLTLMILHQAIAQQTPVILKGTILNEQKAPVPGATAELFSAETQKKVAVSVSDSTGAFSFKGVSKGNYRISITSIGFKRFLGQPVAVKTDNETINIPAYTVLKEEHKELQAVEVKAKKPLLEHEADRTIVNVEAMMSAATSNTLEVLEKTPGVIVNPDGTVSLNGKNGVLVMIDGRQTYMSGPALAAYLKSVPGSSLDKIELISNPPARYDAEGGAIINIKLKRNVLKGVNGNLALGYSQGKVGRSNNSLNLNYGRKKVNFFTNLAFGVDGDYSDDSYDRKYFDGNQKQTSSLLLNNYSTYHGKSFNGRIGLDYAVTSRTNVGVIFNYNGRPNRDKFSYDSRAFDGSAALDSVAAGGYSSNSEAKNFNGNINFLHKFKKPGRELSAEVNYLNYHTDADRILFTDIYESNGTLTDNKDFRYDFPSDIRIFNGQVDYVHPIGKTMRLDGGLKASSVENNSIFNHFDWENTSMVKDEGKSDNFLYKEKIAAGYLSFRKTYKRVSLQVGARTEHTSLSGRGLTNGGSSFDRSFTNFFPSFFTSYKVDSAGKHVLNFTFSKRMRRPNYQQLNPFLFYQDEYSFTTGNPNLKPSFQYQFELGYRYRQLFGITAMHNHVIDMFFNSTSVENDKFISRPRNVRTGTLTALLTNVNFSPTKWWKLNTNLAGGYLRMDGATDNQKLNPSLLTWRLQMLHQFKMSSKFSSDLVLMYSGGDVQGQTVSASRWRLNSSVQMLVLKSKGSIRLSAEDIFRTWRRKDETVALAGISAFHLGYNDTRRIGIAFTWSFGKKLQKTNTREHSEKLGDEKERI